MEKFEFLVRYWELRARFETLGAPLSPSERVELLSLLQLMSAEDSHAHALRSRRGIPVQLTAGSGFLSGELREASPDRLVIGAAEMLPAGRRTIVYLADAVTGVEYTLPCTVAWSRDDEPCVIGLTPDGVPTRSDFTLTVAGLFRSPLGIGAAGHRVEA